jgi:HK97 family phage prohead protease
MERRFIQRAAARLELRAREGKLPQIAGYGAVFYNAAEPGTEYQLWTDFVERIMPGAFDRAVAERDDARALFNHDPTNLLGRIAAKTLSLEVDATGLAYTIDPPDTQMGRDVVEMIRRGDLSGSSFAFEVTDEDIRKEKRDDVEKWIREIRGVKLYDVGPVTYPAYEATTTGVRAAVDVDEVDALKKKLDARQQRLADIAKRAAAVAV